MVNREWGVCACAINSFTVPIILEMSTGGLTNAAAPISHFQWLEACPAVLDWLYTPCVCGKARGVTDIG